MTTLAIALAALPHRDLRAIATRLRLRQRGQHHKNDWIQAIQTLWLTDEHRQRLLHTLSPPALAALTRLLQAGELPAPLFWNEYGPLRQARPGAHWQPPPWEHPQTISEELYYLGLLYPAAPAPIHRSPRLTLPADLRASLLTHLPPSLHSGQALPASPPLPSSLHSGQALPASLIHDLAQLLCLAAANPLPLLHARWLPPAALAALNHRLLQPEPQPLPRSHKQAPRLRLLIFLALAAGLLENGALTPTAWDWLSHPPALQLRHLWDAWRAAPHPLRQTYLHPTSPLPAPWPDLALTCLSHDPDRLWTPSALAHALLGPNQTHDAFFAAHLPHLNALDAAAAALLRALAEPWGVLQPTPLADAYRLTPLGQWLLTPAGDPPPFWPHSIIQTDELSADEWRLTLSPWAPPLPLAQLAPYSHHHGLDAEHRHQLRLSESSVAAAAAQGHGLPPLLAALAALHIPLDPARWRQLQTWHARGHEFTLQRLPLLRAARPELLARLLSQTDFAESSIEALSSTTAIVAISPADLAARLRAAGFYLSANEPPPTAAPCQAGAPASPASLWLAGQLYAALGQRLTLPLPPPFPDLAALLAQLSPPEQALVQAQAQTLRQHLHALLDGQTFLPPPHPTDPAHWQPLIEAAISAGRTLTLHYFSAGRNLLTRRAVTPFWIEDRDGVPYLRADCHLAGRVLLFRLDRIHSLE